MDLLLILTYTACCVFIFKVFKIPLNKWSVPTAVLGGVVILGGIMVVMNYLHPYAKYAKEYFVTVPIMPAVKGIVMSVDAQANVPLKKGDILFTVDPKPYQYTVENLQAQLADANQLVKQNAALYEAAQANVERAVADRDRAKTTFERYTKGAGSSNAGGLFSEQEIENRKQLYIASEAAVASAEADMLRAKLAYEAEINGTNTKVAQIQAALDNALYDLERTVVRAPSDGMVTQVTLKPGVMAVPFPVKPAMIFIPVQNRLLAGSFWQNSLTKMSVGTKAEVILDAVPGHVFTGKLKEVLPAMSEGELQTSTNLFSASAISVNSRAIAIIELDENLDDYNLPRGIQGKVAILSEHDPLHVSMLRRVLLRMMSWLNYVFPIK